MSEEQSYGSIYAKHNLQSNRQQYKESPNPSAPQSGRFIATEKQCAQETNRRRRY